MAMAGDSWSCDDAAYACPCLLGLACGEDDCDDDDDEDDDRLVSGMVVSATWV